MRSAIEMAKEAGFMLRAESVEGQSDWWECFDSEIETLVALVREDEREMCAKVAEQKGLTWKTRENINPENAKKVYMASQFIATAIRARGNT